MMHSSIRFSLVGAQVGCTTKMSRARTFCWISTSTSPSEKRPTMRLAQLDAQVRGDLLRQRRVGVAGEQHGVEQHEDSFVAAGSGPRSAAGRQGWIWQGRKDSNPRMSESKSDALTNLATPLHRTPARAAHLETVFSLAQPRKRVVLQTAAHPTHPARRADRPPASPPRAGRPCRPLRTPRCPSPSCGCCRSAPPATAAASAPRGNAASAAGCRSLRPNPPQPRTRRCRSVPARKPASITASVSRTSSGLAKIVRAWRCAAAGLTTAKPLRRQRQRRQPLADAFDEGVAPAEEERHVGAQRRSPSASRRARGQCRPHRRFSASSVVAASELPPPRPAPQGTRLSIEMSAPSGVPDCRLQRARGAQAQVVGRQRRRPGRGAPARPSLAPLEVQRVAPVDQHEHRLQQVVAVGAPPDDVQEQVQLGRRRHVEERLQRSWRAGPACARSRHRPAARSRRASDQAVVEAGQVDRQPSCSKPGPGGASALARPRRARAGRAASRTARASGSALAEQLARQRVEVGDSGVSPCGVTSSASPGAQRACASVRAERRRSGAARRARRRRAGRRRRSATAPAARLRLDLQRQPAATAPSRGRRRRPAARRSRPAAAPRSSAGSRGAAARVHRSTCSRASVSRSTSLVGVALARLAPDAPRLVALADGPQHLAEVGGDLGVGPRLVGLAQQAQRLVAVAEAVLDPAQAVGDERVARASARAPSGSACVASARRRLRSASE